MLYINLGIHTQATTVTFLSLDTGNNNEGIVTFHSFELKKNEQGDCGNNEGVYQI